MVSPVKTIDLDETLDAASSLLTRYNINVVPVTEKGPYCRAYFPADH